MIKIARVVSKLAILCILYAQPVLGVLNFTVIEAYNLHLSFTGTTAYCEVTVHAQDPDAEITATIQLQKQNAYGRYVSVESWKETGTGYLSFYDTYANAEPGSYRLKVDIDATGSNGSDSFSETETAILNSNHD